MEFCVGLGGDEFELTGICDGVIVGSGVAGGPNGARIVGIQTRDDIALEPPIGVISGFVRGNRPSDRGEEETDEKQGRGDDSQGLTSTTLAEK